MSLLTETCGAIAPVDDAIAQQTQKILDQKTKPLGSLGVLESLACRLAAIYGCTAPALPAKAVVVMAADHGVTEESVSAYPSEVTAQMVANFHRQGAAINVFARQAGAQIMIVDMGVKGPAGGENRGAAWMGPGTANMARGPAMTHEQALRALTVGIQIAETLCASGIGLIAAGEMGIGNTTAASALTAVFTGEIPERVTGRGTGIDDLTWNRKVEVVKQALATNQPRSAQPVDALARVGGFELAGLAGLMLGAAARRVPVLLDGFITGAAALVAVALCPPVRAYLVASHQSVEPGHRKILEALELRPLLNLDLRLGEGTGAVLAMYLVDAALLVVREMATFTSAGISGARA